MYPWNTREPIPAAPPPPSQPLPPRTTAAQGTHPATPHTIPAYLSPKEAPQPEDSLPRMRSLVPIALPPAAAPESSLPRSQRFPSLRSGTRREVGVPAAVSARAPRPRRTPPHRRTRFEPTSPKDLAKPPRVSVAAPPTDTHAPHPRRHPVVPLALVPTSCVVPSPASIHILRRPPSASTPRAPCVPRLASLYLASTVCSVLLRCI